MLQREYYRILLAGVGCVGKTAITSQFTWGVFNLPYDPICEEGVRKQCIIDDKVVILEVLETIEQSPDHRGMREHQLRDAEGFLLVYSITSRISFEEINRLHQEILRVKDSPIVMLGNKCDLELKREVELHEGRDLASQLRLEAIEVSAKQGTNIDEAFTLLVREIREYEKIL